MNKIINFGIIGAGRIAKKFAEGISYVKDAKLIAVASRSIDSANAFGDAFGVKYRYDSYEALAKNEEVDVVYIATPNALHKEHTLLCLKHKKAVICEKPFAANMEEVKEMIQAAKDNRVFLMEAMWTRFFPLVKEVKKMVHDGIIGKVKMVKGDFGFKEEKGYDDIRFSKSLAGGAVMDVGIYPISFASMIFGSQPKEIKVMADIGPTGVDELTALIFGYDEDRMALLSCAIMAETPRSVSIIGEKGYIHIPDVWYAAKKAVLKFVGEEEKVINMPMKGNGYNYEIEEVVNCLKAGQLESDIMPLNESLEIQETLDKIRKQMGIL